VISAAATALGAGLAMLPAAELRDAPWPAALAYLLAIGAAWRYVLPKAWASLRALRLDMNVLMTVAVIGAVGLGEWLEGATVAVLFAISHLLESWSVNRARRVRRPRCPSVPYHQGGDRSQPALATTSFVSSAASAPRAFAGI